MNRLLPILLLSVAGLAARAEDWALANGTIYKNVTVLSHDAGFVVIMHEDGGGRVLLRLLPPDLQSRFGYNRAAAAACEKAAISADAKNAQAVVAEADASVAAQVSAPPAQAGPTVAPEAAIENQLPVARPLTDAEKTELRAQLAVLWNELDEARRVAAQQDAASTSDFESHAYTSQNGEQEHRYSKGATETGAGSHAAIDQLKSQIDELEGKLHETLVAKSPKDVRDGDPTYDPHHHDMDSLGN